MQQTRRFRSARAAFPLLVTLVATAASAENLLVNPGFDGSTLDPWAPSDLLVALDDLDRNGDPTSDSALVTEDEPQDGGALFQLVTGMEGENYTLAGCTHIASGQSGVGFVQLGVNFLDAPCGSPANESPVFFETEPLSSPFDTWICPEPIDFVAPLRTQCIEFFAFLRNEGGTGVFEARFDDLELLPEPTAGEVMLPAVAAILLLGRCQRSGRAKESSWPSGSRRWK